MGSRQSQPTTNPPPANEAVRPSASPLNPRGQSILSYFFNPSTPSLTHDHLHPTALEVRLVSRYLIHLGIPSELIPKVLDEAEYWSGCRRQRTKHVVVNSLDSRLHITNGTHLVQPEDLLDSDQVDELPRSAMMSRWGGLRNMNGECWYLASSPVGCTRRPRARGNEQRSHGHVVEGEGGSEEVVDIGNSGEPDKVWIRKCVIETLSKDQGWSSNNPTHYGTYEQSYSWFEISLLRGTQEVQGSRHSIQYNVHAGQYYKPHCNILPEDHPTLKLARPGDRIVLWIRAEYQVCPLPFSTQVMKER
uniref:Uncharacterized protein n=1 Tax=Kwoniella bestiolae CBS 10118 TaxID=1296100 RepID=A0A1B9G4G1_9TREE|nr:hypothetical protein I302_03567 [Kwoniella bestiolae CBS 10118]OCF25891.1 hypothetical protein I302_03567 [Kwoniella bestiolae CBS 10118]